MRARLVSFKSLLVLALKVVFVFLDHLLNHLAADRACLTCGKIAVVALVEGYAYFVSGFVLKLFKCLLCILISHFEITTLQFLLYNYLNEAEQMLAQMKEMGEEADIMLTPRGVRMTVTMVTVIPILCVYPFMQRYLIKGIMIGAVKG